MLVLPGEPDKKASATYLHSHYLPASPSPEVTFPSQPISTSGLSATIPRHITQRRGTPSSMWHNPRPSDSWRTRWQMPGPALHPCWPSPKFYGCLSLLLLFYFCESRPWSQYFWQWVGSPGCQSGAWKRMKLFGGPPNTTHHPLSITHSLLKD